MPGQRRSGSERPQLPARPAAELLDRVDHGQHLGRGVAALKGQNTRAGLGLDGGGGTRTPDTRIMIPARFGLAIGDSRPVGQAVGRNRTFGRAVFCVSGLSNLATDRTGSARAGPIRALVGTVVGTKVGANRVSAWLLLSARVLFGIPAVQGVLDEHTAYGPARATFYGTGSEVRILSGALCCWGFGRFERRSDTEGQPLDAAPYGVAARSAEFLATLLATSATVAVGPRRRRELVARQLTSARFAPGSAVAQPVSLAMSSPVARAAELRALSQVASTMSSPSRCRADARWTAS
jgi:hypothetical protein